MEIRKYYFLYDCYCKDDQFDDSKMFDEHEEINIRTSIPHIFYEKISEIEKTTGLSHTQIYKYLIINSLLDEDCHVDAKVIVTDIDMIDYAHELGLSYLKLLMFLNAMVKSNKILFIEDSDNH